MICLAYLSSAAGPLSAEELGEIVAVSNRNNSAQGVTGLLCHYDGSFLQFLEGPEPAVQSAFERIRRDPRHRGLIEVYRRQVEERLFADWSMAIVKPDQIGPEQRSFCQGLRQVEMASDAKHRTAVEPFLHSFRAWIR